MRLIKVTLVGFGDPSFFQQKNTLLLHTYFVMHVDKNKEIEELRCYDYILEPCYTLRSKKFEFYTKEHLIIIIPPIFLIQFITGYYIKYSFFMKNNMQH